MTCREFTDKVTEYLEGQVPYGEHIGMWMHSLMCVHCRHYLDQIEDITELLGELGDHERDEGAPAEVKSALVEQFKHRHSREG